MKKSLPPLNWFRAFEASARRLSFTAAADEIGLTQSAVSQQIRALETRLGQVLFERRARGLALTDEGRKLLPQVETALETLSIAVGRHETPAGQTGLLVSASISVTEWVISPALPGFLHAHPDLSIRFLTAIWPDEFAAARADVEIRFGSAKQAGKDAVLLLPNDLVALKSPALQDELGNLPLIEAVGTSRGWADWGKAAGFPRLAANVFVDSYGLAMQLAADGNGVALVSSILAGHSLRTGTLERAHDAVIPAKEGYYLSLNQDVSAAVDFAEWIASVAQG